MAMFTQRHFEFLAKEIKQQLEFTANLHKKDPNAVQAARFMAISLACALKRDNEKFDIDRFYEASGLI